MICGVLGAALAVGVTASATPQYESKVGFFVVAPSTENQSALQADELVRGRIDSYTALMTSRQFLTQLVARATSRSMRSSWAGPFPPVGIPTSRA